MPTPLTAGGSRNRKQPDRLLLNNSKSKGATPWLSGKIRLVINVTTSASGADIEKVKADLHRFCPVSKVVRNSNTQIEEVWNVTRL